MAILFLDTNLINFLFSFLCHHFVCDQFFQFFYSGCPGLFDVTTCAEVEMVSQRTSSLADYVVSLMHFRLV